MEIPVTEPTDVEVFLVEQSSDGGVLIVLFDGEADGRCVGIISCRIEAARQLCKALGSVLDAPKT